MSRPPRVLGVPRPPQLARALVLSSLVSCALGVLPAGAAAQQSQRPAPSRAAEIETVRKQIREAEKRLQQESSRAAQAARRAMLADSSAGGADPILFPDSSAGARGRTRVSTSIGQDQGQESRGEAERWSVRAAETNRALDSLRFHLTFLRASDASERGDTAEAVRIYREAAVREGPGGGADYNAAMLLAASGQLDSAAAGFTRVIDRMGDKRAATNLAWVAGEMLRAERYDAAAAAYATVVKLETQNVAIWYNYGLALTKLDRWADALRVAETAVSVDPTNRDANVLLYHAYVQTGQQAKAEAQLRRIPPA